MANPFDQFDSPQTGPSVVFPAPPKEPKAPKTTYRVLSPAEKARMNLDPSGDYQISSEGQVTAITQPRNQNNKLTSNDRAAAIGGYTSAQQVRQLVADLKQKYASGPGATSGLMGVRDYLPTPGNRAFDATGDAARGMIKNALGFTGGENNTAVESRLNIGPYLPEAGDYDNVIQDKIARLERLADQAEQRSIAILGGVPDANGNVTPVDPNANVRNGQMQINNAGTTQDRLDPETSRQVDALIRAGRSDSDIAAFLAPKNYPMPPKEQLDAARAYLKQNPNYRGGFTNAIDRQNIQQNVVTGALGVDPNSSLGAYGVASANALTMGGLDEIAGGNAQQAKDLLRQEHPGPSLAGDITGSAIGMAGINGGLRFAGGRLAGLATRGGGIGGDMLYGAGFGAGEGNDDRLTGALTGGLAAGAGNLVGRGLVSGAGRAVRGISSPDVGYLAGRGVRMTPGQILGQGGALGRGTRAVEDALESIPFLGSAIRMRKMEGLKDFNREAFKDALAPIGEQVQGTLGQDAIGEAQDLVSGAYGNALNGVSLRADMPFVQQVGQHIRAGREIPKVGDEFDYTIKKEIAPLFGPGRTLDGPGFQEASQTAQGAAADFAKMGTRTGGAAANQMRGVRSALLDLAGRQAPDTVPGLLNANAANKNVSILGDAVTGAVNSNVDGGIFTPAQLGRYSVNNTKKYGGKKAAARGDVPFAELQQAGQAVQPNVIPNSGSFDRAFASLALPTALGGSAYGAEQLNAPTPVVAALGGLSLLSTRKGNDLFQALVTSRNPKVRQLGEVILQRARLGGMFGGAAALPYSVNP